MKIEFVTTQFIAAYGRSPRGRGMWMFSFEGRDFQHSGTFAEARKACVAAVRAAAPANYSATVFVEVCS